MPGPRPKPDHLRMLEGSSKKTNPREPEPEGGLGAPPERLPAYVKTVWFELAELVYWGTAADRGPFEILTRNVAKARKLAEELETEPAMIQGSRGLVRNPKSYELREAEDRAARMYAEFALTPASRSRVKVPPPKSKPGGLTRAEDGRIIWPD